MLTRLSITNYALIRELEINFSESFSVITGETGAGKSIILGALGLILGQRAENLSLADKSSKCCIEGTFNITNCNLEYFFSDNDLDYEEFCIIRREITPQGKSRAFINDTPVGLNQLKELTSRLVDVHSQHQTLLLQESSFQQSVIDSVAGNGPILSAYAKVFRSLNEMEKAMELLLKKNQEARNEQDYLNFLFDELEKAALKPGEQELLEKEAEVLGHAEEIKARLFNAAELLINSEDNILRRLNEVANLLQQAGRHHPETGSYTERLSACIIELKDIAEAVNHLDEATVYDPEKLAEINDRLAFLYNLEHKHHVKSTDELLEKKSEIEEKISGIASLDEQIEKLKKQIEDGSRELIRLADELALQRRKFSKPIEEAVLQTIRQLGIKDAGFCVDISKLKVPGPFGSDRVRFLFSANKGSDLNDLSKIASGGELSRLMLAVKSLISSNNLLPTIIFDEIDSGISGDVASKTGSILTKMSEKMQVIVITHLPQIAGRSNEHFKVYKYNENGKTFSSIVKLNNDERVSELALMISGNPDLEAARETARELLKNN
jgi:DNA repair protein RecN (Recombination protein N)